MFKWYTKKIVGLISFISRIIDTFMYTLLQLLKIKSISKKFMVSQNVGNKERLSEVKKISFAVCADLFIIFAKDFKETVWA